MLERGQLITDRSRLERRLGLVNRDERPGNLFLVEEPRLQVGKLLDFGIER